MELVYSGGNGSPFGWYLNNSNNDSSTLLTAELIMQYPEIVLKEIPNTKHQGLTRRMTEMLSREQIAELVLKGYDIGTISDKTVEAFIEGWEMAPVKSQPQFIKYQVTDACTITPFTFWYTKDFTKHQ